MVLADYGAEVVKIEQPGKGDDTRSWGPPFLSKGDAQESTYFLSLNRNKKSVVIDIKKIAGQELVKRLSAKADVFIENFVPGKLKHYGLDYSALSRDNPHLIYASLSGYGQRGPYAQRPGYDVIVAGEGGLMSITGTPEGPPVKPGVALTDMLTGLYLKGAIASALYQRERTGCGQYISTSLFECQLASLINIGAAFLMADERAQRWGSAHASIVPYQSFPVRDGYFTISGNNDEQFTKLAKVLGRPDWPKDLRFSTNANRVKNRNVLVSEIEQIMMTRTIAEWEELFRDSGIPAGPVNDLSRVFDHPQTKALDMVKSIHHPQLGEIKVVGSPVSFSSTPHDKDINAPPRIGQHTDHVLKDWLEMTDTDIGELRNSKAIQ
jgi:succinate--hydroxymethylglutarate CoA-transferase